MSKSKNKSNRLYMLSNSFWTEGLICIQSDKKGFNEYRLYEGKWIEDWPDDVEFVVDGKQLEDFIVGGLHWRLISDRVRKVLEQENIQSVQFLPVKVFYAKSNDYIGPYWVLNIIRNVNSLRWEFVSGLDFFRRNTDTFVSERLKHSLVQANVTRGVSFTPVPLKTLGLEKTLR
jgi:hypothetical protein